MGGENTGTNCIVSMQKRSILEAQLLQFKFGARKSLKIGLRNVCILCVYTTFLLIAHHQLPLVSNVSTGIITTTTVVDHCKGCVQCMVCCTFSESSARNSVPQGIYGTHSTVVCKAAAEA